MSKFNEKHTEVISGDNNGADIQLESSLFKNVLSSFKPTTGVVLYISKSLHTTAH